MEENINPVQNVDVHKDIYTKTFLWMFLGLLATAFVSVFSYATGFTINFIEIWPVLLIVEVVVVIKNATKCGRCAIFCVRYIKWSNFVHNFLCV